MNKQEREAWDELYNYVRYNVLGYDENQSLSRNMVLRLKGLQNNKFMANNNIEDTANYSFEVILNTFKFCQPDIQRGLRSNSFIDEHHKWNYILKIVENNLNNVYVKMKNAQIAKEKTENVKSEVLSYNCAEYQKKTKKTPERLKHLW